MGCSWCQDGWGPPGCPAHDRDRATPEDIKQYDARKAEAERLADRTEKRYSKDDLAEAWAEGANAGGMRTAVGDFTKPLKNPYKDDSDPDYDPLADNDEETAMLGQGWSDSYGRG